MIIVGNATKKLKHVSKTSSSFREARIGADVPTLLLWLLLTGSTSYATVLEYADDAKLTVNGGAATERSARAAASPEQVHNDWRSVARAAAVRHGIPEVLFLRLIDQESRWKVRALSPKGAFGLAQLMPATARMLGVDRTEPAQNLEGGARYLAQQFATFGTWRLALAAYNAGPEAVKRHGGIPPYRETRNYVATILRGWTSDEPVRRVAVRAPAPSVMEFSATGDLQ